MIMLCFVAHFTPATAEMIVTMQEKFIFPLSTSKSVNVNVKVTTVRQVTQLWQRDHTMHAPVQ